MEAVLPVGGERTVHLCELTALLVLITAAGEVDVFEYYKGLGGGTVDQGLGNPDSFGFVHRQHTLIFTL
eukprot:CAMPEP_0118635268 /NCGR_PEP_ID=MMETSP0785-20121206/1987_1 /TAXON_ID=91992 /ORGANISM="Bolidomonas pacifica, Strain CCMP 1866" /LENGTH=68 /DNA_ID=CAMNT_0006526293 /DNA_START=303 /DNA_END=509 /DNA_ORIENTATION=+